jgi:hypothetical protein
LNGPELRQSGDERLIMIRLATILLLLPLAGRSGDVVSFNAEVRPILSDHCFSCHGADPGSRKAGLRLDTFEGAAAQNEGMRAIVPGDPAKSELWNRITSGDEDEIMPPPESHKALTQGQKEILKRWIETGADYEPHWSFVPPVAVRLPGVNRTDWPLNGIDHFVLARLEAASLGPSPEAAREALLRRVTLDLTGLPPTEEEAGAFLEDESATAYEKLVDRLLVSPHFGEHLAVAWLDAARYADTNGYFGDKPRQMWLWRDWVIDALNANVPFDRFTIEQLAGDLLPGATVKQRIATGFNRNHMANNESGSIDEEFRVEYVVDRVDTTMATWTGLTAGCAQCHDHKFDPISKREFYGLFAFFNNVPERGLINADNPPPILSVPSAEQETALAGCLAEKKAAEAAFAIIRESLAPRLAEWEKEAPQILPFPPNDAIFHEPFDGKSTDATLLTGNAPIYEKGVSDEAATFDATQHFENPLSEFDPDQPWTVGLWVKPSGSLGCPLSKIEAEGDRRGFEIILQKGRVQVNLVHRWSDSAIEVATVEAMGSGDWHHLVVSYDGSRSAKGLQVWIDGAATTPEVRRDHLTGTIVNREPLRLGRRDSGLGYYGLLDEVRLVPGALDENAVRDWGRGERLRGIVAKAPEKRNAREREILLDDYLDRFGEAKALAARERLRLVTAEEKALREAIPTVLVMEEMKTPRATFVLERGVYDQRREEVEPHVPAAIAPWPENAPANRLGFAQWLVSERHPLTARVAVNRLWAQCFGEGLVRTPEDFGLQGEAPTHPELLDHLALRFRESGWDVKALLKEIVMSRTYRQNSAFTITEGGVRDPANRLLGRGPSGRLSAEILRDQSLALAGLLVPTIGGPGVKPYQPPGLWEAVSYNAEESYAADTGDGLWRRSLYTYLKRQAPPPAMLNFDGPTREKCTVRRGRTSTPLQALQMLNDETHVEAARVLAERVLQTPGNELSRLEMLWRRVLVRSATTEELAGLSGLLQRQKERFSTAPAEATSLLGVGAAKRDLNLDAAELASWTIVAQVVLNLDETLTKP